MLLTEQALMMSWFPVDILLPITLTQNRAGKTPMWFNFGTLQFSEYLTIAGLKGSWQSVLVKFCESLLLLLLQTKQLMEEETLRTPAHSAGELRKQKKLRRRKTQHRMRLCSSSAPQMGSSRCLIAHSNGRLSKSRVQLDENWLRRLHTQPRDQLKGVSLLSWQSCSHEHLSATIYWSVITSAHLGYHSFLAALMTSLCP